MHLLFSQIKEENVNQLSKLKMMEVREPNRDLCVNYLQKLEGLSRFLNKKKCKNTLMMKNKIKKSKKDKNKKKIHKNKDLISLKE